MSHADVPILKVEHLSYRYPTGQIALCDVSFAIGMHEVVGLVGPNGAGKTTLLLHLNGLLMGTRRRRDAAKPQASAEGVSRGSGRNFAAGNVDDAQSRAGRSSGDARDSREPSGGAPHRGTVVSGSGRSVVLPDGARRRGVRSAQSRISAGRSAAARRRGAGRRGAVGIEDRPPQHLSFGEKRRVCLAGVLACEPSLLALDEPSSNLDPRARRGLIEILKKCPAAQIIASHDLELVVELCSRVIVLDQGRIQADGPAREILADEKLMARHGLEVPLSIQYGIEIGNRPR